jgi:hypothetical protein
MSKRNKQKINWLDKPEKHNYPSAMSYLSLLMDPQTAKKAVQTLELEPITFFKARDIFRASGLPLLGISQHQIEHNLKKIKEGESLSPILLVRDIAFRRVIVADGYHRLWAVYHHNNNLEIPCQIIDGRP